MLALILATLAILIQGISGLCPIHCNCPLQTTNCSNLQLTYIPVIIDSNVEELDLSNNNITEVQLPENLENLVRINLSNNNINGKVNFPKYDYLDAIDLSHNLLERTSHVNIKQLPSLKVLNLSKNSPLGLGIIKSKTLEIIEMNDCNLTDFTIEFFQELPFLRTLKIRNNSVRSLDLFQSKNLVHFDVSGNQVSTLNSSNLRLLPSLKILNVTGNTELRVNLNDNDCHTLEIAFFSHTGTSNIEINSLCKIEEADFSFNSISQIKETTFNANILLHHLNLSFNSISEIDQHAFGMNNLKSLDLSHNILTRALWSSNLTGLLVLNISGNSLKALSDFKMKDLLYLNAAKNSIYSIDVDFSTNLPELNYLDLTNNLIEYVPKIKSSKITKLLLGYCQITNVVENAFSELYKSLVLLDLSGNKLIRLHYNVFSNAPSLRNVYLSHNPWSCNCQSERFLNLYIYLLVNHTLTESNSLNCNDDHQLTWHSACQEVWSKNESRSSSIETFLAVVGFFILCMLCLGLIVYVKRRRAKQRSTSRSVHSTDAPSIVEDVEFEQHSIRRVHSEADVLQRSSNRASEAPPPSYEEALLLPPVYPEVLRMTRSMDILNRPLAVSRTTE